MMSVIIPTLKVHCIAYILHSLFLKQADYIDKNLPQIHHFLTGGDQEKVPRRTVGDRILEAKVS